MNKLLTLFYIAGLYTAGLYMAGLAVAADAEDRFAGVEIKTIPITDHIYMLMGSGGNIGVSVGEDGLLIVDDQYAPLSEKIKVALSKLGDSPPTFLLNTHYHGDHTGGNKNFAAQSLIMAHDNVHKRLSSEEDFAAAGLPVVTFKQQLSIHFNGEDIKMIHMPNGHTDGDSIVFFSQSNVVHMGDHFFKDRFPYVDLGAGGTVDGLIVNIKETLNEIADDTRVIPGHGDLANKSDLEEYYNMLVETSRAVKSQINAGRSLGEILDTGLSGTWDSWAGGFINEERWIQTLYKNFSGE
jgi:glyoxylase-like metal-dependent hydrolase (beta-lactamase superfamily II)